MERSWEPGELSLMCPGRIKTQGRVSGAAKNGSSSHGRSGSCLQRDFPSSSWQKILQPWHLETAAAIMLILGSSLMKPLD